MAYNFDTYFLKPIFTDDEAAFSFVRNHFSNYETIEIDFEVTVDPFSKRLRIIVNKGSYGMVAFYNTSETAQANLDEILGESVPCYGYLRIMFAPDPELEYDSFAINLLDDLEKLNDVVVYMLRSEKIAYASPQFAHLVK